VTTSFLDPSHSNDDCSGGGITGAVDVPCTATLVSLIRGGVTAENPSVLLGRSSIVVSDNVVNINNAIMRWKI